MKKYSKIKIYLTLAILAMVCYACPSNDGNDESFTVYDTADGSYLGDLGTGTAVFLIDMYNAADDNVGIYLFGFAKLPSSLANLDVTGTYSITSNGAALTFLPGSNGDNGYPVAGTGTFVYNYNTKQFTLVTGGTFDIALSGGKYIITTDFTGKDYKTGAAVSNLKYSFTGNISFKDLSGSSSTTTSFTDIVASNYTATGDPGFLATPGPSSWSGQVSPSTGTSQFYSISGWGGKSINVSCNFNNGQITMDNSSQIATDAATGDPGYFQAVALNMSAMTYQFVSGSYVVAYNKSTKVMDFSGTYNGVTVYVGIVAKNKTTGSLDGAFTELYANAKLTLTPQVSQSSSSPMRASEFSYSSSISGEELKGFTMDNKPYKNKPTGISLAKRIIKN